MRVRRGPWSEQSPGLINEQTERMSVGGRTPSGQEGDRGRGRGRERSLSLSPCVCVCAYCLLQQFHNPPTGRPTSQAGRAAPFHSHMNSSSTTTGKGLLCFHLQVLSPTSLGVDLVIIINNCRPSRDKPSAFQNSWFCF